METVLPREFQLTILLRTKMRNVMLSMSILE